MQQPIELAIFRPVLRALEGRPSLFFSCFKKTDESFLVKGPHKKNRKPTDMGNTCIYVGITALCFLFLVCIWSSERSADLPAETTESRNGNWRYGRQCYENIDPYTCFADCECGGCGIDGCMPGNCDGPTRTEDANKCEGKWGYGSSCPCGGVQKSERCSRFNGDPSGCRRSCWCGYCSPLGCTEGDDSGPDSGACNNPSSWQFFGPC